MVKPPFWWLLPLTTTSRIGSKIEADYMAFPTDPAVSVSFSWGEVLNLIVWICFPITGFLVVVINNEKVKKKIQISVALRCLSPSKRRRVRSKSGILVVDRNKNKKTSHPRYVAQSKEIRGEIKRKQMALYTDADADASRWGRKSSINIWKTVVTIERVWDRIFFNVSRVAQ